jgi:hypothetical protein
MASLSALIERSLRSTPQGSGWVGLIDRVTLAMRTDPHKRERPWCRGRESTGDVIWFPRTAKRPWEGERYAVFSPARSLPKLELDGWFLADQYVTRPSHVAVEGEPCGRVDQAVLDALYAMLRGHYWVEP